MKQSIIVIICFFIVYLINQFQALVCPIYRSKSSWIQNCQRNCSFTNLIQPTSACLGVYMNRTGEIVIKQLDTISSDNDCMRSRECLLEQDPLNSQIFSCCCSTNNCTLNWKIISFQTTTKVYSTFSTDRYQLITNENFVFS